MCAVSHMGDYWRDRVLVENPRYLDWINDKKDDRPSKEEFEKLKKEIKELKKMLKAAKKFDESTGQKDCEMNEKVDLIKKFAKMVDINMEEIFK